MADARNARVQYFDGFGTFLGKWGSWGTGEGEFFYPKAVAVSGDGRVFVTENFNHRVQYFTTGGSFIGMWGSLGQGEGEFNEPRGVATFNDGKRVYVADRWNDRVQYFRRVEPGVEPCSLGRVKALFE